jgi:hypothetical protein
LPELTTTEVLTMTYLNGRPIESLREAPAAERNRVAAALLDLALREVFEWGLVQTDPNFANYLYVAGDGTIGGRVQLLDFGATRDYPLSCRAAFRDLLLAALTGDDASIESAAIAVGYLGAEDPPAYRAGMVDMVRDATEPARADGGYHFGRSDLARRISDKAIDLRVKERFGRLPPPAMLFLHRKLGGLYLLFSHLRAEIRVREVIAPLLAGTMAVGGATPLSLRA